MGIEVTEADAEELARFEEERLVVVERQEATRELVNILEMLETLGQQAQEILQQTFPEELHSLEAYDALSFGCSSNPYDTTFAKTVETLRNEWGD